MFDGEIIVKKLHNGLSFVRNFTLNGAFNCTILFKPVVEYKIEL